MRKGQTPRGIACRHCGCCHNEVREVEQHTVTYHGKPRIIVKRRRVCRHCRLPFTTIETYEDEDNYNLPEDVVPFKPPPPPTGVYCPQPESAPEIHPFSPADSGGSKDRAPHEGHGAAASSSPPKKPQASGRSKRKAMETKSPRSS